MREEEVRRRDRLCPGLAGHGFDQVLAALDTLARSISKPPGPTVRFQLGRGLGQAAVRSRRPADRDLIAEQRLSGTHWWDPDRIANLADIPRFCPNCGGPITGALGISVEHWEVDRRVYHT